jgi:hypothetical protein
MTVTMTPAMLARQTFVASQIAIIKLSGHEQSARWMNAVIRAGEAFLTRTGRGEMTERCKHYNTTLVGCECEAGQRGAPCKHRAFRRLIQKWEAQ